MGEAQSFGCRTRSPTLPPTMRKHTLSTEVKGHAKITRPPTVE